MAFMDAIVMTEGKNDDYREEGEVELRESNREMREVKFRFVKPKS